MEYEVQDPPYAVASADFNGDGKKDIAVASSYSTLTILLATGRQAYPITQTYTTPQNPQAVSSADLNGDGKIDLVVSSLATTSQGEVSVFLGNGDGTFQPRTDYLVALSPVAVAIGDFNGDGKLDIVTANFDINTGGDVSVLLGNGDGTFTPAVTYLVGETAESIEVGDFNHDGKLDIVTTGNIGFGANLVSILLGNGDGTFQTHVDYPAEQSPGRLAVGDINEDGNLDIVTTDSFDSYHGAIGILLGNGDGSFQAPTQFLTTLGPYWIGLADLDGDGHLDLITNTIYGNLVNSYQGTGTGTFLPRVDYVIGPYPEGMVLSDLNGDGFLDLIAADSNAGFGHLISVLLNKGKGH